MVALQINSFLRSRPRASAFLNEFSKTQAVEFLAEWSLTPTNVAFLRVQTGVMDALQVGDKPKWFAHALSPIRFPVWDDGSSLNGALRSLKQFEVLATDESCSDSEHGNSSSSSYSSLSDFVTEMVSSDLSPSIHDIFGMHNRTHNIPQTLSSNLDSSSVYHPPKVLCYPDNAQQQKQRSSLTTYDDDNTHERPDSRLSSSSSGSDDDDDHSCASPMQKVEMDFSLKSFEMSAPITKQLEATINAAVLYANQQPCNRRGGDLDSSNRSKSISTVNEQERKAASSCNTSPVRINFE